MATAAMMKMSTEQQDEEYNNYKSKTTRDNNCGRIYRC